MNTTSSIALSGMQAAQVALQAAAHNVANLGTAGFRRQEVVQVAQAGGGVTASTRGASNQGPALVTDVVAQIEAKNAYLANFSMFKAANRLKGVWLDEAA